MRSETIEITTALKEQQVGLLVQKGCGHHEIQKTVTHIGRASDNDIVVKDPCVSSYHCQIEKRQDCFFIRDLKSRNGIRVNGVRVNEAQLADHIQIQVAGVDFTFLLSTPGVPAVEGPLQSKNKTWALQLHSLKSLSTTDLPVFLQGESGSGKEVVARTIHELSLRKNKPFVSVNCSALTENLVESELFGHMKGSFTGASSDRKGAFETARGGTLFLDEIGDLPPSLQPKLLRALENSEIKPVGSDQIIATDVRVITATHKNIADLVTQELFRADLYFRIHVIKVQIPALRERMEDFDDIFYDICQDFHVRFSEGAIEELRRHSWPGNIRELKNTISRASALFPDTFLSLEHLPFLIEQPIAIRKPIIRRPDATPLLQEVEKEMIRKKLVANKGNQRKTARELGIPKSTLHDRIKNYGITI